MSEQDMLLPSRHKFDWITALTGIRLLNPTISKFTAFEVLGLVWTFCSKFSNCSSSLVVQKQMISCSTKGTAIWSDERSSQKHCFFTISYSSSYYFGLLKTLGKIQASIITARLIECVWEQRNIRLPPAPFTHYARGNLQRWRWNSRSNYNEQNRL